MSDQLQDRKFGKNVEFPDRRRGKENRNYVDNKKLVAALTIFRKEYLEWVAVDKPVGKRPKPSDYIGDAIMKICNGLSMKPNFIGYTYRDEMVEDAIEKCVMGLHNFDPERSSNPFAYLTQTAYFEFLRRLKREKRQQDIKKRYIAKAAIGEVDSHVTTIKYDDPREFVIAITDEADKFHNDQISDDYFSGN